MKTGLSLKQAWTALILFAVIVPVSIVMIWHGQHHYKDQLSTALISERHANELLRNQIESELKRFKTLLKNKSDPLSFLLDRKDGPTALKDINGLLKNVVEREQGIHEVIILSKQADVITVVDPSIGMTGDKLLSAQELSNAAIHWGYDKSIEYPEIVIPSSGRVYMGPLREHEDFIAFSIAVPIGNPAKAILVALIDVNKLRLTDANKEHGIGIEKSRDYILNRRGTLLTEINDSDYKPGDIMTHLAIARTALVNGEWPTDTSYIGAINQPVYGTLTTIPSLGWTLVSEVIVSEIIQPILASLLKTSLLTLLGIILFIWFALRLANRTLEPIQEACDAIDYIAKGDFQVALEPSGIRELDAMSSGINRMTKERQKFESSLQAKEKEQGEILNSMIDGVITIDETGKIISFNPAAEKLFGYNYEEVIEKNISQLMPNPYADAHDNYIQRHLKTGESRIIGIGREVTGLHKNKHTFPIRLSVAELPVDETGTRRYIGNIQDLTQEKQQEEHLRRTEKMDALGKLTSGVAHDYNNVLSIIRGYSELLEDSLSEQPQLSEFAGEILHASKRGARLTDKLLAFSRKRAANTKTLNLNELLQGAKHMLKRTLTARIQLGLNLAENLWPLLLDSSDVEDAIVNLSINAMHAIDGNGQINIRTNNEHLNEIDAKQLGLEPGDYVLLGITDTGCGMDKTTKEKIFEPFYSTKGEKGTGLGLSQISDFMERSNGAIKVYSEIGHGTRFALYFPRLHEGDHDEQRKKEHYLINTKGTETILVVDDENSLLKLTRKILEQQGYKVICTQTGEDALNILATNSIDLLITDIIMSKMDGYQLAKAVHDEYPSVKIQLVSGFADDRHRGMVDDALHENMLHKPYASNMLLTRVRNLLDED